MPLNPPLTVFELVEDVLSINVVASIIGCHHTTVRRWVDGRVVVPDRVHAQLVDLIGPDRYSVVRTHDESTRRNVAYQASQATAAVG